MLKPSGFILALFAMFSTSVLAQDLRVCPNVQVGVADGLPVIYSDCTMDIAGTDNYILLGFGEGDSATAPFPADDATSGPIGNVTVGTHSADAVTEDMGPNYTGTCNDMAASIPTFSAAVPTVDGNVYCARWSNTEGNQLWLRGTVDVAGRTWKDPIVLTNQPGVGTPYSPKTTVPVPVLPFWALLSLAGLIGLFGFRKFRT